MVYNGANALEMGWTEEYEQIKGVLLCVSPGATGFNALGSILNGTVNPSGKTVDTWLRDVTRAALAAWEKADGIVSFVNYVEGIYVGYRFFETAFDKTDILEPGESQTMTLSFELEDIASYDTYGTGHYILEEGEYTFSLRTDAHTVVADEMYVVTDTIVYDENELHNGDVEVGDNKLSFAEGEITYLSGADGFANYETTVAAPTDYEVKGTVTANGTYHPED